MPPSPRRSRGGVVVVYQASCALTVRPCTVVQYNRTKESGSRIVSKHAMGFLAGVIMLIAGAVLFFVFHDIETPIIGLRQAGLVIAVLGVVEIVATAWSKIAAKS